MKSHDGLKRLPRGISAVEMEIALADMLDFRKNICVPRVERGAGLHECDFLMLRPTRYAEEYEIKITKSDLMKDLKKEHKHESDKVKQIWYAVPMDLVSTTLSVIEKSIGIVGVARKGDLTLEAKIVRDAAPRPARKWTDEETMQLMRLGYMRIWKLKKENTQLLRERSR